MSLIINQDSVRSFCVKNKVLCIKIRLIKGLKKKRKERSY